MNDLLTEITVAARLGVSRQTLWRWRRDNVGPPHIKIGRTIRYSESQLDAWISSQEETVERDGVGAASNP